MRLRCNGTCEIDASRALTPGTLLSSSSPCFVNFLSLFVRRRVPGQRALATVSSRQMHALQTS